MGNQMVTALMGGDVCCGVRAGLDGKLMSMPDKPLSVLQDDRIHFINDAPMVAVMRGDPWGELSSRRSTSPGSSSHSSGPSKQHNEVVEIKDVNGISLFKMQRGICNEIKLYLPTGHCHTQIIREGHDCWHVYVGKQRRVTVCSRKVADNDVFLVHEHAEPYPEKGCMAGQVHLPLPCLSVRGDFPARNWFVFDCSDLSIERRVARSSGGLPEGSALFARGHDVYSLHVSAGLDVALVVCIGLIVDDWLLLSGLL